MMIKVDNEYLDFNEDIEIEQKANLFEDIASSHGDFSYSFEIQNTTRNKKLLGIESVNKLPSYSTRISCVLFNNSGEDLYHGYLRIESVSDVISCSFYSGNSSWIDTLNVNLRSFNYAFFDKDFTYTNVTNSFTKSTGIVWPLIDKGTLNKRKTPTLFDNDWHPFIYVKDIVRTFLAQSAIKLEGEIMSNPIYNNMITTNGGLSGVRDQLDSVSVYAGKTSAQLINSTSYADVSFQDTTNSPFFEGEDDNWGTTQYTVTKDLIELSLDINLNLTGSAVKACCSIKVLVDGADVFSKSYTSFSGTSSVTQNVVLTDLYAGSVIKVQARKSGTVIISSDYTIKTGSSIKFSAIKLRKVYAAQLLPDLTASEYLASLFARLCIFATFNYKTQTIHTRFLNNIKRQGALDLSNYIVSYSQDMTTLISDYGKKTNFLYQESGIEEINKYNSINATPYGGGTLEITNDFIEDETDLIELEEVAPYQISIPWLGISLPLLAYSVFEYGDEQTFTSVVDDGNGFAQFNCSATSIFTAGDLFRCKDASNSLYDGVHMVTLVSGNSIVSDFPYDTTATGTVDQVIKVSTPAMLPIITSVILVKNPSPSSTLENKPANLSVSIVVAKLNSLDANDKSFAPMLDLA